MHKKLLNAPEKESFSSFLILWQAAVIGSWHNRSYEDKDGNKRTVPECIADDVQFLGGPRRDNAPGGYDDDYPFPDEE